MLMFKPKRKRALQCLLQGLAHLAPFSPSDDLKTEVYHHDAQLQCINQRLHNVQGYICTALNPVMQAKQACAGWNIEQCLEAAHLLHKHVSIYKITSSLAAMQCD